TASAESESHPVRIAGVALVSGAFRLSKNAIRLLHAFPGLGAQDPPARPAAQVCRGAGFLLTTSVYGAIRAKRRAPPARVLVRSRCAAGPSGRARGRSGTRSPAGTIRRSPQPGGE